MSSELPRGILDASVLIQDIVKEKYTDIALKLVERLKALYVPSLAVHGIGNALAVLACKSLIAKEDAIRKFRSFISIPTIAIREITLGRAMEMAIGLEITLYDASYLALALEAEAPLITADKELYEKGKSVAKVVHVSELIV